MLRTQNIFFITASRVTILQHILVRASLVRNAMKIDRLETNIGRRIVLTNDLLIAPTLDAAIGFEVPE